MLTKQVYQRKGVDWPKNHARSLRAFDGPNPVVVPPEPVSASAGHLDALAAHRIGRGGANHGN